MRRPAGCSTAAPSSLRMQPGRAHRRRRHRGQRAVAGIAGAVRRDDGADQSGNVELVARAAHAVPPRGEVGCPHGAAGGGTASAPPRPRWCAAATAAASLAPATLVAGGAAARAVAHGVQLLPPVELAGLNHNAHCFWSENQEYGASTHRGPLRRLVGQRNAIAVVTAPRTPGMHARGHAHPIFPLCVWSPRPLAAISPRPPPPSPLPLLPHVAAVSSSAAWTGTFGTRSLYVNPAIHL